MARFDPSAYDQDQPPPFDPSLEDRAGSLKKILLLAGVGLIVLVAVVIFAMKPLMSLFTGSGFSKDPSKIHAQLKDIKWDTIPIPQGYEVAASFSLPNGRGFIVRHQGDPTPLPKDADTAFNFQNEGGPYYCLMNFPAATADGNRQSADQMEKIRAAARASVQQDKIWVAGQEMPAMVGVSTAGTKIFRILLLRFPQGLLFAATPTETLSTAPDRDMVGAVMRARPDTVSFTPPEPPSMRLARAIATGDVTTRKNAVTQIAVLDGAHPEAVTFLANELPKASPDTKVDIVAGLGFLAKRNGEAIPVLIGSLQDKSVRLESIAALGSLGATAGSALPALQAIAKNKKEPKGVRAAAQQAINRIQGYAHITPGKKPAKKAHGRKKAR